MTGPWIDPMERADWPAVRRIYQQGIHGGQATFETDTPDWASWDGSHLPPCRLVAREAGGDVVGWAALAPVSSRAAYRGVAELSVYVAEGHRGRGVGRALLTALIQASEQEGFWTLQTGVFPENEASLALHRSCGFRVVGTRERIGRHHGRWRDVIFLERRSPTVGTG